MVAIDEADALLINTIWRSLEPLVRAVVRAEIEGRQERGDYMTTTEAAVVARLKPATIREWVKAGRLRAHRIGRLLRITRADLDHAIANPHPKRETTESRARSEARRALVGR